MVGGRSIRGRYRRAARGPEGDLEAARFGHCAARRGTPAPDNRQYPPVAAGGGGDGLVQALKRAALRLMRFSGTDSQHRLGAKHASARRPAFGSRSRRSTKGSERGRRRTGAPGERPWPRRRGRHNLPGYKAHASRGSGWRRAGAAHSQTARSTRRFRWPCWSTSAIPSFRSRRCCGCSSPTVSSIARSRSSRLITPRRTTTRGIRIPECGVCSGDFDEIDLGVCTGPSSALSWILRRYLAGLLTGFSDNRRAKFLAEFVAAWLTFPIKYLDYLFAGRPGAAGDCVGVLLFGQEKVAR